MIISGGEAMAITTLPKDIWVQELTLRLRWKVWDEARLRSGCRLLLGKEHHT
jgi:hypothetical protein